MNRGRQNADGRVQGPVGMLVRGIAAGIGLASESYQHHKGKKASNNAQKRRSSEYLAPEDTDPNTSNAHLSHHMDEAVWELDEAQDHLTDHPSRPPAATEAGLAGLADSFIVAHAARSPPYSVGQLALPVIITQRRPGSRTKGFVRAYSPLLSDVGIDQSAFLDFLDKLNKSIAPSPWIQAINLAALAGQNVPEPFTIMISLAVKQVADAASELQSRSKTNRFLDKVNENFFAPRGLVALVMTWKPSQQDHLFTRAEFDMQSSIAKASDGSKSRRMFESSSGATSFEWPTMAPLIFPALDDLLDAEDSNSGAKKQSVAKRSGKFVGEYMDKRARAKWAGDNPDSNLANASGKEHFSSKYADPTHAASSGDPLALLTGGLLHGGRGSGRGSSNGRTITGDGLRSREGLGAGRLQDRFQGRQPFRGGGSQDRQGLMGLGQGRSDGRQRGGVGGGLGRGGGIDGTGIGPLSLMTGAKKLLQNDVLYLMVVQRPSEDQMVEALGRINSSGRAYR